MAMNYLAILVAAVVSFLIGMLWYSPLLFGNIWMKLMGFSKSDLEKSKKKGMGKTMFVAFIAQIVMVYVLSYFVSVLGYTSATSGMMLGFWIWLGFYATSFLGSVLWDGRPFKLYLINVLHYLVVLEVAGAILAAWA